MERSLAVIGAGVFGASLARHCARAGWRVTLVEQVAPGHARAASGDESRLIRCSHGEDAWHTALARRAWQLWLEIDPRLVAPAGVAWFARREDGWEAASEHTLRAQGIPCERVDPAALFPGCHDGDLAFTLFEPEAGILRAREATRELTRQAVAEGAELVLARARPDGAAAVLDSGRRLEADHVVWTCGAWLRGLFPGLMDEVRITQQDVFYFGAGASWRTPRVPGWVDYDGAAYGLGDLDGRGVKVAPDVEGPPIDAETARRVPLARHERLAREYLAHRFPPLAAAPLVGTRTCHYEITPDTRFVVAPHPGHGGRVWLVGGSSGHGFKHGPALAERLEGWLTGATPPDPRLGLGARDAHAGLRTAGAITE